MIDNYEMLRPGHWHQIEKTGPGPVYSTEYVNYYNRIPSDSMSKVRYNVVKDHVGHFESICDFGYGNGAFLNYCVNKKHKTYGYDISEYPLPPGTSKVNDIDSLEVDVLTFFDSIEHIPDADLVTFLRNKKIKYVVISLPWFHEFLGPEWFQTWKHRKPNEHFHHFDMHGLVGLLTESGYTVTHVGNEEDSIRKGIDMWPNILTVVAKKND
jgi:hypothetical protein